jgi:putative membrane protein
MIEHYTNHAANERTYLAWIRTAISIMAFGFLIEKFDLFIAYLGKTSGGADLQASRVAEVVGVALFVLGVLVIIAATLRFFAHKAAIDSTGTVPYGERKTTILLSAAMVLLAIFSLLYILEKLF